VSTDPEQDTAREQPTAAEVYSPDEEQLVAERLAALGYIE
jgi:hypothetical protein